MTFSKEQLDKILESIDNITLARDMTRQSRERIGYETESRVEELLNESRELLSSLATED